MEQDGIPRGRVWFTHESEWRGPAVVRSTGCVDGDVGISFGCTAEPCGEKITITEFDDGGGVTGFERGVGEDEFGNGGIWRGI
jgi:hypothetical protein